MLSNMTLVIVSAPPLDDAYYVSEVCAARTDRIMSQRSADKRSTQLFAVSLTSETSPQSSFILQQKELFMINSRTKKRTRKFFAVALWPSIFYKFCGHVNKLPFAHRFYYTLLITPFVQGRALLTQNIM